MRSFRSGAIVLTYVAGVSRLLVRTTTRHGSRYNEIQTSSRSSEEMFPLSLPTPPSPLQILWIFIWTQCTKLIHNLLYRGFNALTKRYMFDVVFVAAACCGETDTQIARARGNFQIGSELSTHIFGLLSSASCSRLLLLVLYVLYMLACTEMERAELRKVNIVFHVMRRISCARLTSDATASKRYTRSRAQAHYHRMHTAHTVEIWSPYTHSIHSSSESLHAQSVLTAAGK